MEDTTCKNLSAALDSVASVSGEAESLVPKPLVQATIGAIDEALGKLQEIIGEPGNPSEFSPEELEVLKEAAVCGVSESPPLAGSTSQPVTPTVLESTPRSVDSPHKFPNPMDAAKPKAAAKRRSTQRPKAKASPKRKRTTGTPESTARRGAKAEAKAAAKSKSTARAKAKAAAKRKSTRRTKKAGDSKDQDLKKKLHSATRFKTENKHEHKRFKEIWRNTHSMYSDKFSTDGLMPLCFFRPKFKINCLRFIPKLGMGHQLQKRGVRMHLQRGSSSSTSR